MLFARLSLQLPKSLKPFFEKACHQALLFLQYDDVSFNERQGDV